jgi:hypothetical protein
VLKLNYRTRGTFIVTNSKTYKLNLKESQCKLLRKEKFYPEHSTENTKHNLRELYGNTILEILSGQFLQWRNLKDDTAWVAWVICVFL